MVRGKSKASKKQNTSESSDTNESPKVEKEDNSIVPDDEGKLDAEMEESAEKEFSKSEENDGTLVVASDEGSEVDEVWDITRVIPTAEEKIKCRYEHCSEQAVATWATNKDPEDKWPLCEKCQFEDFGGWPEGVEPIERSIDDKVAVPPTQTTAGSENAAPTSTTANCTTPPRIKDVGASLPNVTEEPIITQDEGDPETVEEKYELSSIISFEKLRSNPVKCSDENCKLPACSIWTSTSDPKKWYYCIDCQEKDFGGWPPSMELPCDYLPSDHLLAIATKCSKKRKPSMPVFASKCVTPNPSLSPKGRTTIPEVAKGGTKPPTVKISRAAVARHEKWQADAKKLGVNRIIVKKNEAKKVIFDALYDSFRPMNIENIYMMLKKMIPLPVLKAALDDMSMDWKDYDIFGSSDDDDDDKIGGGAKENKSPNKEAYAGSLFFKAGRSVASSLYYVDHNKIKEMSFDEKRELSEKVANTNAEREQLAFVLKELNTKTTQLLSQPTNHVLIERLGNLENEVETLAKEVDEAKALTVNESHKKKLKRKIQSMAGHYRKRKQLCCSFLSSLEEISDGTISKKKCLKGDGQIALDSDETVNKSAIAYAKSKKRSKTKTESLADENFVGVALDSQKMIKRVYVNDE